jgi:hypothetical protein
MNQVWGSFYDPSLSLNKSLRDFKKDTKALSAEFKCEHAEKAPNNSLINDDTRESSRRLSLSHHFDLKVKGIMDIIEIKNPNKPFSLEQNAFIVKFLCALEKPLKEIKLLLNDDNHQDIAFSRIEEKIRKRLEEELKTIRDSHSIFNTYKGSLAIADGMENDLRLKEDFKSIFSKLLSFGFEDLATNSAFRKIQENGFNHESIEILKKLKSHINDFHEQKQGTRSDQRIFKNPFADLNYQNFLEAIFTREIKASNFLKSQPLENLNTYLNFSEELLKSKPAEISPNELFEVKLKHKILQNLDEINYKADLDINNFKKLINIIDENRGLSLTKLPSIEEYIENKLNIIFSKPDGEDKLTKLNLTSEQFATLILESRSIESQNKAKNLLLRSLKNVQSTHNFIGTISTLGNLKVRLGVEHKQQILEFITEKTKDFNELKNSQDPSHKKLYENFILGMKGIYGPHFSLEKLNSSHLNNDVQNIPETSTPRINIKRNQDIFTEFQEKDLLKRLSSPNEDIKNNAFQEIKQYFKESQSADEFQRNSNLLRGILDSNRKDLSKVLRQKCIEAAFNGYMENRRGDEEIKLLEMQKNSAINNIY